MALKVKKKKKKLEMCEWFAFLLMSLTFLSLLLFFVKIVRSEKNNYFFNEKGDGWAEEVT